MKISSFSVIACSALLTLDAIAGTGPRIHCKEPAYQFGDMSNTGVVEHVFLIENKGDAPLHVNVRACCGATASLSANQIEPGTNATLAVTVSIGGVRGQVNKTFYVGSDDPAQPYYQLRVTGTARAASYVDPGYINFGDMRLGEESEKVLRLVASTNLALSITNIAIDAAQFTATYTRTNDGYCITVRTAPLLKPGVTQGNMRILTDNKAYPQFDVHLSATLGCDILVVPQEITLVVATGKVESVTRYLAIRSKRGIPFKILSVEPPEPGIEVKVDALSAGGYRVEMRNILPFPELAGKRFVIRTDHDEGREIPVPIRAAPRP